jgi:hypothetical protein
MIYLHAFVATLALIAQPSCERHGAGCDNCGLAKLVLFVCDATTLQAHG